MRCNSCGIYAEQCRSDGAKQRKTHYAAPLPVTIKKRPAAAKSDIAALRRFKNAAPPKTAGRRVFTKKYVCRTALFPYLRIYNV